MCAKYEDVSAKASSPQKLPMLSNQEMRQVLDDVLESEEHAPIDEDLSGVLGYLPDLEEDCSILSLGLEDSTESEKEETAEDKKSTTVIADTDAGEGSSQVVSKLSPSKDSGCWSKVKTKESPVHVPIQKGDMIEFLVENKTWFLVEVTGRGKVGGKNRNYLNVKYDDGSEGGVFIDRHQWRFAERKEVLEEVRSDCSVRLHRVSVGDPCSITQLGQDEAKAMSTDDDILVSELGPSTDECTPVAMPCPRERRRRKRRKLATRYATQSEQQDENIGHHTKGNPASLLRKGDIIEFLVEENDDDEPEDTWFTVEVLGRGKASGRNRNYLNVRYKDKSEGGVFIDRHQWRLVRRSETSEGKK